jgi:hypothetical protein
MLVARRKDESRMTTEIEQPSTLPPTNGQSEEEYRRQLRGPPLVVRKLWLIGPLFVGLVIAWAVRPPIGEGINIVSTPSS